MGGRGASSGIRGKNKKAQKGINSLQKQIDKHLKKINELNNNPNISEEVKKGRIHHWEAEIDAFKKNQMKKARKEKKK